MLNIINSFIEISGSESNLIRKIRYKRENDASFLILRLLFEKSREWELGLIATRMCKAASMFSLSGHLPNEVCVRRSSQLWRQKWLAFWGNAAWLLSSSDHIILWWMFSGFCVVCKQHVTRHSVAFQPRVPTSNCRSNVEMSARSAVIYNISFLLSLHLAAVSLVRTRAGHQEQWLFTLDLYSAILPVQFGAFFLL